ncbi:hypothetical protein R1A27_06430 [Methylobacterium sp. NMS12]|uniref:hypothetical protein n=1 Tax=Methylobacterium sp. NMS12 TaxID=3079766 RepID=UPI003F88332F
MDKNPTEMDVLKSARSNGFFGPVWMPFHGEELIGSSFVKCWCGFEVLCYLARNLRYLGSDPSLYAEEPEVPYDYIFPKAPDGGFVRRPATPPSCDVDAYDWDEFERTACRS